MKVLAAVAAIVTSLALVTHAQTRSVDWRAERPEILKHFRALVQIDSSNPPGNEGKVVAYLKSSDPARRFARG
jgi:hypothetical protein